MTAGGSEEFEAERPRLLGLAYRMLGEIHEAEDAVQDAYLRWSAVDREHVEVPSAWLAKVVTNLCINRLTSARARRESYPGPWLPEPVFTAATPLETAELRDTLSYALLTLMERLTPAERAVFVLREAFSYSHQEIAEALDVTETSSRQLHHRAKQRLGEAQRKKRFEPQAGAWRELVERFLGAAAEGDVARLEEMLATDVTAWSDGGGKVGAGRRPVSGRAKVARLVMGIAARGVAGFPTSDLEISVAEVNAVPAIVARFDGRLVSVIAFDFADGRIAGLYMVVNPDKLSR